MLKGFRRVLPALAGLCLALAACGARPAVLPAPVSPPMPAPGPVGPPKYSLYTPPSLPATGPVRLVVALHGVGGNGADFAKAFVPLVQAHGWLLAAPTFSYGNWHDPGTVRSEDVSLCRQLQALIDNVRGRMGRDLRPRVFVVGFSRGAQLADRFALFDPQQVAAVASLSAGTYTLPEAAADVDGDGFADDLPLPFGTADMEDWLGHGLDRETLRRVAFWVSVGAEDNNPNDLPRQWDPLLGKTRVARAQAFDQALQAMHIPVQLTIYPGAQHQLTAAMADGVNRFLSAL